MRSVSPYGDVRHTPDVISRTSVTETPSTYVTLLGICGGCRRKWKSGRGAPNHRQRARIVPASGRARAAGAGALRLEPRCRPPGIAGSGRDPLGIDIAQCERCGRAVGEISSG